MKITVIGASGLIGTKVVDLLTAEGHDVVAASRASGVDVLTGDGLALAARAGAEVIGLDIATNLLEQAGKRAAAEKLKIEFIEGDAEKLPYEAARFDVVVSMFGAMFAPRPEVVASELLRVCRPGGMIAMGNWTPTGFVGQMFKISASHVPPPPGLPSPLLWGDEKVVTERLGGKTRLKMSRQELLFDYPFAPSEVVAFFRKYFGPTQMTFARLDEAGQKALAAALTAHWTKNNEGDPKHTVVKAEYLEVHATVV